MQKDVALFFKHITISVLAILVSINVVWFLIGQHSGSFWGFIAYSIILVLCMRQNEFRAGVIVGLTGFGVHLFEWATAGIDNLLLPDSLFLFSNLLLPILLTYSSYRAYKLSG